VNADAFSADTLVFWTFVAAWVIVAGLLLFVTLPRIVREGSRIVRRVIALSQDSELPLKLAKAEADAVRINRAVERLPALLERAQTAVVVIRTTPFVPPALGTVMVRIAAEVRAFRAALG
jgi:hypothetical protein